MYRPSKHGGASDIINLIRFILGLAFLAASAGGRAEAGRWENQAKKVIRDRLCEWRQSANEGKWQDASAIWDKTVIGWYPGNPDIKYSPGKSNHEPPNVWHEFRIEETLVDRSMAVNRIRWWIFKREPQSNELKPAASLLGYEVWRRQKNDWKIVRWLSAPEPEFTDAEADRILSETFDRCDD